MIPKSVLDTTVAAFENSCKENDPFVSFLKSLTDEEKECYFYIEAQRSNQFVIELMSNDTEEINIERLKEKRKDAGFSNHLITSAESMNNVIEFWDLYGKLPKPAEAIRQGVITKHNQTLRDLTDKEKEFFLTVRTFDLKVGVVSKARN